jgi:hypothetical protein
MRNSIINAISELITNQSNNFDTNQSSTEKTTDSTTQSKNSINTTIMSEEENHDTFVICSEIYKKIKQVDPMKPKKEIMKIIENATDMEYVIWEKRVSIQNFINKIKELVIKRSTPEKYFLEKQKEKENEEGNQYSIPNMNNDENDSSFNEEKNQNSKNHYHSIPSLLERIDSTKTNIESSSSSSASSSSSSENLSNKSSTDSI